MAIVAVCRQDEIDGVARAAVGRVRIAQRVGDVAGRHVDRNGGPLPIIPATATVYCVVLPLTAVTVAVSVPWAVLPAKETSPAVKLVTASLKLTVKLTGDWPIGYRLSGRRADRNGRPGEMVIHRISTGGRSGVGVARNVVNDAAGHRERQLPRHGSSR